ncbi:hypothetical protein HS088_TW06G00208 [Tripterygium wilfordii]|uniref:Transferring glycosyl group transferase n=2 Tax=Tripterygium wilfordii TaxID=458696 RepID=A0A7J7DIB8_TRIWF|nr:hypothetical protein HS088_TW06G00208 [Tripterygium wilfordii]
MPNILIRKTLAVSRFKKLIILLSLLLLLFLLIHAPPTSITTRTSRAVGFITTRHHVLFSIASSSATWPKRKHYVRLWYNPSTTRAFTFLDWAIPGPVSRLDPPFIVSENTSRFPFSFKGGLRSAIRVARVVKEAVDRNERDVRWFVFGDDDTVFFVDNLVKTLSKYDHDRWFYVGSNSEVYEQNSKNSFDMAFGGGGFAISHSLARVLAKVLDSCLMKYAHLYGSDARVFSCLAELGVGLTHEPGFHQVDMRGNLLGFLSAHPLSPLVSLHHLDAADPIFPTMNNTQALGHLFKAVNVDPTRILQQTVCYDRLNSLTVSVAWGYAIMVFEGNVFLPDILSKQKTFSPWRRSARADSNHFMFNMRENTRDLCKRPIVFFLESVRSAEGVVRSYYTRYRVPNCHGAKSLEDVEQVIVFSRKMELDIEQMKAPRRQCCDISPSLSESMIINIRHCGVNELISMRS